MVIRCLFRSVFFRLQGIDSYTFLSCSLYYKLYSYNTKTNNAFSSTLANHTIPNVKSNLGSFYLRETYGTLACDKDFLIEKYGVNGRLIYLAKSDTFNELCDDGGIII